LQDHRLQHAEHNYVGGDAERQDEDSGGGKTRGTAYLTKSEAQILQN
jgi:hypothetical protein